jgi:5-methyltetrahydrofolate--homocysteine methyltransferase
MASLEYREDMDQVRERLERWWNGEDLGRPVMSVVAEKVPPDPKAPPAKHPPECIYGAASTANFDYRLRVAQNACVGKWYLGESVPTASLYFGTNALATYLGCRGEERPDTFWVEPNIIDPDQARFEVDPNGFYWQFTVRLARELRRLARGKYLMDFPDIIEGLDTLAAMRGTDKLLEDLMDRPQWVQSCLRRITDRYFYCYDVLYDLLRDETGGSFNWIWGPGRMVKLQCDFSAMISPEMFGEFAVPVITEMSERLSTCFYHWDGAPQHHDKLLAIPRLGALQWTPPAGTAAPADPRWWPLYHKTIDAGKKVMISASSTDELLALKREFGRKLNQFSIHMYSWYLREAQEWMEAVQI